MHTENGVRNYYEEALRNLIKQAEDLKGVEFICSDYKLLNTQGAVIYCDPPYEGTKEYGISKGFRLWRGFGSGVRAMSVENIVLISSSAAPDYFKCIWSKPVSRTIKADKNPVQATEKLFISE